MREDKEKTKEYIEKEYKNNPIARLIFGYMLRERNEDIEGR